MKESLRRLLMASPEFQTALIASLSLINLTGVATIPADLKDGIVVFIVLWMAFASRAIFQKDIEDLRGTPESGDIETR